MEHYCAGLGSCAGHAHELVRWNHAARLPSVCPAVWQRAPSGGTFWRACYNYDIVRWRYCITQGHAIVAYPLGCCKNKICEFYSDWAFPVINRHSLPDFWFFTMQGNLQDNRDLGRKAVSRAGFGRMGPENNQGLLLVSAEAPWYRQLCTVSAQLYGSAAVTRAKEPNVPPALILTETKPNQFKAWEGLAHAKEKLG